MTRKPRGVQLLSDDLPIFTGTWYGGAEDRPAQPPAKVIPPKDTWDWCGTLLDDQDLEDETTTTGKDTEQ